MRTVIHFLILVGVTGLSAFAAARTQTQSTAATGVIRVTVRVRDTQEPVAGLSVTLMGRTSPSFNATVSTGPDGVAVFDKLALEAYDVRGVGRDGYLFQSTSPVINPILPPAGATVNVATNVIARAQPVDVPVFLITAGSVSGRVLDPYGVPIPNARVIGGIIGFTDGRRVFQQQVTAQPDATGNYVLTPRMESGEYYLRLETSQLQGVGTYYPGVPNIDNAVKIPFRAGQQVVGIDFNAANPKTYKVNGSVLNLPARTLPNGQPDNTVPSLSFVPADPANPDPQVAPLLPNGRRGANGEFEISLPAGLWDIFPVINIRPASAAPAPLSTVSAQPGITPTATYATGRARVFISDRDVENVSITISATDIMGRIIMDDGGPLPDLNSMRLNLTSVDNIPSPLISHLRTASNHPDADGNYSFGSVPPGRYRLNLATPAGYYVADLRIRTKSIFDSDVIEVGNAQVETLSVILRKGGGTVQVRAPHSTAPMTIQGADRRIILVPEAPRQQNAILFKSLVQTESGYFSNIAPGNYQVFAFEALPFGGAERDKDFIAKYHSFGKPIHVEDGQSVTVDVDWIPAGL